MPKTLAPHVKMAIRSAMQAAMPAQARVEIGSRPLAPHVRAAIASHGTSTLQRSAPSNIDVSFETEHGSEYTVDPGSGLTRRRYYGGESKSSDKTVLYGDAETTEACLKARDECEWYTVQPAGFGTWSIEFRSRHGLIFKGTLKQVPELGLYPVDMILSSSGRGTRDDRFHVGDKITSLG